MDSCLCHDARVNVMEKEQKKKLLIKWEKFGHTKCVCDVECAQPLPIKMVSLSTTHNSTELFNTMCFAHLILMYLIYTVQFFFFLCVIGGTQQSTPSGCWVYHRFPAYPRDEYQYNMLHHKSILSISALFHDSHPRLAWAFCFIAPLFFTHFMQNIYFKRDTDNHGKNAALTQPQQRKRCSIIRSRESSMRRIIESRNKWSQTHIVEKQLTNGSKNGSEYVAGCFFFALCVCVFG